MTTGKTQSDLTIRGGIANVPLQDLPTKPPRHQPNTPPNKKHTKTKPDHQPVTDCQPPPIEDTPPAKPAIADESPAPAVAPPVPQPDEPETASTD